MNEADFGMSEGCSTYGVDVDIELHGFYGIPVSHDTMEGLFTSLCRRLLHTSLGHFTDMKQSKLSLEDDASPLDGDKKSKLKLGLFSYPVLQAADILVHRYVCTVDIYSFHRIFFYICAIWPGERS